MENKINTASLLIGCDPEAFIYDAITGRIGSAIGLIPGTKDKPYKITDQGHAIQTDNVMIEFCVPPTLDAVELYTSIQLCLTTIEGMLPENMKTVVQASAELDKKYLRNKQAKTFGWI